MFDRLIDLIVQFIDLFRFWEVVAPYERAVVVTMGKKIREIGPGPHLIWPFGVDIVHTANVVPTTDNLLDQSLTTKDGKTVNMAVMVQWSISDVRKMLLEVEDAHGVMRDVAYGQAARVVNRYTWAEISCDLEQVERDMLEAMRRRSHHWGMKIHNVQITDYSVARVIRLAKNN